MEDNPMKKKPTEWLEEQGKIAREDIVVSPNIKSELEGDMQYEPRDRTEPVKEETHKH